MLVKRLFISLIIFLILSVNCSQRSPSARMQPLKVALIFIPNVQFAPFYVALDKGFYANQGLDVSFEFSHPADATQLVGIGKFDFIIGDGEQVIIARDKGLPVKYVLTIYARYPVAIASLRSKKIEKPKDLIHRTVGVPEYAGASFVGYKALLKANQLDEAEITLQAIGYTQAVSLSQNLVDAAVVYMNNTPIQLRQENHELNLILFDDYISLVSAGVITNDAMIENKPEIVRKFITATIDGLEFTRQYPDEALEISFQHISEGSDSRKLQAEVLRETIRLYESDFTRRYGTGMSDPVDWENTQNILYDLHLIDMKRDIHSFYTNKFLKNSN